jgi:inhibitor of cysteine peptidase
MRKTEKENEMLRRIIFLVALVIGIFPTAGCSSKQILLTSADNGKKTNVNVGEKILINLEGNPSTGFTWEVKDLDASMLQQVGEPVFRSGNPGLVGAAGTLTLTFIPLKAGTTTLTLVYHRPWETKVPPQSSFVSVITIK